MIALVALAAHAGGPACPRSEDDQAAFTQLLSSTYEANMAIAEGKAPADAVPNDITKDVLAAHKKGELCTVDDQFWGAMHLLQSTDTKAADVAWELAQQLIEARYPRAPWLGGQAYDRWSVAYGRMQAYGTQTTAVNGKRCLLWVDPAFTDEQRKAYGYPTLEATAAQILAINGAKGAPATVAELKKRELWCKPEPWNGKRSDLADPYGR